MSAIVFVCFGIVIVGTAYMLWNNFRKPQKRVVNTSLELDRQRALASTTPTNANTRAAEGPGSDAAAAGDLPLALPPYIQEESAAGDHSGEANDEPPPFVDDDRACDVPAVAVTV
ncbi:hypothetical protein HDU90_007731 [Geranomyces variabilis]|nr:hypothetical protein HDU90_007731 [Geranomyces variabilis]